MTSVKKCVFCLSNEVCFKRARGRLTRHRRKDIVLQMDVFQRKERVRSFECGADNLQRPDSLLSWIMDSAEDHAEQLGFGRKFCEDHTLAWVEYRLSVSVRRFPAWGETVDTATWTSFETPLIAVRDFTTHDVDGCELVRASCRWVLIDAERRRPVPLKKKLPFFASESMTPLFLSSEKLEAESEYGSSRRFVAERSQVDFNGHINNAVYLIWALNSLPPSWVTAHRLCGIEISFVKETFPDLEILGEWVQRGEYTYHRISAESSVRALLQLKWEAVG